MSRTEENATLTTEQIETWRTALIPILGPYALIMPEKQIQSLRDKMQEWLSEESKRKDS